MYLVRHGQSQANVDGLFGLDTTLTGAGIEQAKSLASNLKTIHFDAIFSSDLVRAHQTAKIIAQERKLKVETSRFLREKQWGSLEGKLKSEVRHDLKHLFDLAKSMPDTERINYKVVPDMENEAEMMERYVQLLREVAVAYLGKTVLIVSHQTIMRTFLMHIGYVKYTELPEGSISNAGYIKLLSDGTSFKVSERVGVKSTNSWF
jgi:broad specificity phosphatase PhoE